VDIQTITPAFKVSRADDIPAIRMPSFAFAGRSNAGKSSVINSLLRRKRLATVSKQPGRTRALHYYLVNEALYIVDLPGYGHASVSRPQAANMQRLLLSFLEKTPPMRCFLLMDIRRTVKNEELDLMEACLQRGIRVTLVLTKADKLNQSERHKTLRRHSEISQGSIDVISASAKSGRGIVDLWRTIETDISSS